MAVLISTVLVLGLVVGSLVNRIVDRVPSGTSVFHPAARCPAGDHSNTNRHSVRVRGRQIPRGGGGSVRCPVVEVGTAALFVAMTLRLAAVDQLPALPACLYFVAVGVALTLIDIRCHRLPNAIVLPSYPVVLVLLGGAAVWQHDGCAWVRALIGTVALFGAYFVLAAVHPAGMGSGDVKLAGVLGGLLAYWSPATLAVGTFTAFLLGAVAGAALLVGRRCSRKTAIPFGPYMVTGALFAIFAADPAAMSLRG